MSATPDGAGGLRVGVAATSNPGPANSLVSIQLGNPLAGPSAPTNALVDIAGLVGASGPATFSLPAGTTQTSFTVHRAAAGQATTVPLLITDACGVWPTIVGGGPTSF